MVIVQMHSLQMHMKTMYSLQPYAMTYVLTSMRNNTGVLTSVWMSTSEWLSTGQNDKEYMFDLLESEVSTCGNISVRSQN